MATSGISTLTNTVNIFAGGTDGVSGSGAIVTITFGGTWLTGEEFSFIFTDTLSGLQTLVGAGNVAEFVPSFLLTFQNKVYAIGGSTVYFSAIDSPTVWNDPNGSGNSFVTLTNWYSTPEPIVAASPFQGNLAFFARRTVQIWTTDSNPDNWSIQQILVNIGTIAPLSVQPLGDFDVIFLYDSGLRSLRVRDFSLNAYVNDMGAPIDALIQASLIGGSVSSNTTACGVVEPSTGRYWCYLNGLIYVLSYYPTNKIIAWSTYQPTDSAGNVMNITSFQIYNGQVWAYGTDSNGNQAAWQYGGSGNNTYDQTKMLIALPFFDAKTPGLIKALQGFDAAINAGLSGADSCTFFVSSDYTSAQVDPTTGTQPPVNWTQVYTGALDTFSQAQNAIPVSGLKGTHFSVYAQFNGDGLSGAGGPALLSLVTLHYEAEDEKI